MDPSLTAELTGTPAIGENPAKAVVSINVIGASGEEVEISGLADPIEVVFTVSTTDSLVCAYVDEAESRWSRVGVWRHAFADGRLTCRTSHLTIFGALTETSTFGLSAPTTSSASAGHVFLVAALGAAVVFCSALGLHIVRTPRAHLVLEENVAELTWDLEMAMASKSASFAI
jgi:hypothetical protein